MKNKTILLSPYRPGFVLQQTFRKPSGIRYKVTGWIYNPEIELMNKRAFNEVEFVEVVKIKEMDEWADQEQGEVFVRSLEYLFQLCDENKLVLE